MPRAYRVCSSLILLLGLTGCVTNPVTGDREMELVGEERERAIGEAHYLPGRQMQGGDYVVDPALQAYVSRVGARLAAVSDRSLDYEFTILNNSTPNAWALPGGKIAVNRGLLLELENEAQLAAVLGHEIVHAAARHGAQALERGLLIQGAVLAAATAARENDYGRYVIGSAQVAAQLINQRYNRAAELEADRWGMIYMARAGYDPRGAVGLQETFVRLAEEGKSDWLSGLFASHPPSQQRVQENRRTAEELGEEGVLGVDAYAAASGRLRATRVAYDHYDHGRRALAEGKPDLAMRLAGQAIEVQPEEGQFFGLRGDVAFALRDYASAERHYTDAIGRNSQYFKFYLGRGESRRKLENLQGAEADLKASMALLPTADAATALGQIAEAEEELGRAIALYAAAAGSETPAGEIASRRLVALDLPRRPERYVPTVAKVDRQGQIYLEIQNLSGVPLRDLRLLFVYRNADGRVRQESRIHTGRIPPGESGLLVLGSQYVPVFNTIRAQVTSARPADEN